MLFSVSWSKHLFVINNIARQLRQTLGNTGEDIVPKVIFALIQFVPLTLFATYAFWDGVPDDARWEVAFKLASLAAVIQLAIVLPQRRPSNRLVLAANLYLLLGGLAFLTQQWWFLRLYDELQESAIFIMMLVVGIVATLATPAGYIGAQGAPVRQVKRTSYWLLLATALALALAVTFRGDRYLAAVYPIIGLAIIHRWLLHLTNMATPAVNGEFNRAPESAGAAKPGEPGHAAPVNPNRFR